jgi:transcriptional regulator with XRE-family HTH domain
MLSIMKERASDLNMRVARRVRELRARRGVSLDGLARKSGVSRSMISLIERGETSSTAVVLEKLAAGLDVTLGSLFDAPGEEGVGKRGPVARRGEQVEWRDPGSGYVRRNVSPAVGQGMQIVEVRFPAGGRVAFESGVRERPVAQQVWVLEGAMEITVGKEKHKLETGDCLAMTLDGPTMFFNPGRKAARYVVVTAEHLLGRGR